MKLIFINNYSYLFNNNYVPTASVLHYNKIQFLFQNFYFIENSCIRTSQWIIFKGIKSISKNYNVDFIFLKRWKKKLLPSCVYNPLSQSFIKNMRKLSKTKKKLNFCNSISLWPIAKRPKDIYIPSGISFVYTPKFSKFTFILNSRPDRYFRNIREIPERHDKYRAGR